MQNALWWYGGDGFITDGNGPPTTSHGRLRFFGWSNMKQVPRNGRLAVYGIPSDNSLLLNCAQELYSAFLMAITQAVKDLGGQTESKQHGEMLRATNETVDEIQSAIITRGLCDAEDAFACTIPVLRHRGLLEPPDEIIVMAGEVAENYRRQKRWSEYAEHANWALRQRYDKVVSKLSHEQDSTEAMEAMNDLRLLLVDHCQGYIEALQQKDNDDIKVGYQGILHLLDRYSQDDMIKKIPLVWTDCGNSLDGNPSTQPQSLADTIRSYGEAARYQLEGIRPRSGEEDGFLVRLREHCPRWRGTDDVLQAMSDRDLGSTARLLAKCPLQEPQRAQALQQASQAGWYMIVKHLVLDGAASDKTDSTWYIPLMNATRLGDINTVRVLIRKEAINIAFHPVKDWKKEAYKHALEHDYVIIVEDMMENWQGSYFMRDKGHNYKALMDRAIKDGDTVTIRALMRSGRCIDPDSSLAIMPVLHIAIYYGSAEVVDVLLEYDAVDLNLISSEIADHDPPLVCAVKMEQEAIFDKILRSSRVNADLSGKGHPALWWAAFLDLESYVEKLLDSGKVQLRNYKDSPLSIATKAGHRGLVRRLLAVEPATAVNLKDILIAAKNGHIAIVEELLLERVKNRDHAKRLLEAYGLETTWRGIQNSKAWEKTGGSEIFPDVPYQIPAPTGYELGEVSRINKDFTVFRT
ncbi:hypothetical protein IL306_007750 [Fusarium sp. DS 682]|nr:hypothetical protein IL306_007750 [Fusarium sp. DS 682]